MNSSTYTADAFTPGTKEPLPTRETSNEPAANGIGDDEPLKYGELGVGEVVVDEVRDEIEEADDEDVAEAVNVEMLEAVDVGEGVREAPSENVDVDVPDEVMEPVEVEDGVAWGAATTPLKTVLAPALTLSA